MHISRNVEMRMAEFKFQLRVHIVNTSETIKNSFICFKTQVSTGNLLAILDKHYQAVTCIKFTDDGSHFVSAGQDNLVIAWSLAR